MSALVNGDREAVEKVVDAALASLEANRQRIDDLNVYPVPDGDTGTNLTLTVAGARRGRRPHARRRAGSRSPAMSRAAP